MVPHSIAEVGCDGKMAVECGCPESLRRRRKKEGEEEAGKHALLIKLQA